MTRFGICLCNVFKRRCGCGSGCGGGCVHKCFSLCVDECADENQKDHDYDTCVYFCNMVETCPHSLDLIALFLCKYAYDRELAIFSKNNKYHIAVDTEGSFKSAVSAYLLSGKTAGFRRSGFKGYLISKLYDETILFDNTKDVKILTFELLAKTFGFENKDIEIGY